MQDFQKKYYLKQRGSVEIIFKTVDLTLQKDKSRITFADLNNTPEYSPLRIVEYRNRK